MKNLYLLNDEKEIWHHYIRFANIFLEVSCHQGYRSPAKTKIGQFSELTLTSLAFVTYKVQFRQVEKCFKYQVIVNFTQYLIFISFYSSPFFLSLSLAIFQSKQLSPLHSHILLSSFPSIIFQWFCLQILMVLHNVVYLMMKRTNLKVAYFIFK